jgi:hypothetical protein
MVPRSVRMVCTTTSRETILIWFGVPNIVMCEAQLQKKRCIIVVYQQLSEEMAYYVLIAGAIMGRLRA